MCGGSAVINNYIGLHVPAEVIIIHITIIFLYYVLITNFLVISLIFFPLVNNGLYTVPYGVGWAVVTLPSCCSSFLPSTAVSAPSSPSYLIFSSSLIDIPSLVFLNIFVSSLLLLISYFPPPHFLSSLYI